MNFIILNSRNSGAATRVNVETISGYHWDNGEECTKLFLIGGQTAYRFSQSAEEIDVLIRNAGSTVTALE